MQKFKSTTFATFLNIYFNEEYVVLVKKFKCTAILYNFT